MEDVKGAVSRGPPRALSHPLDLGSDIAVETLA